MLFRSDNGFPVSKRLNMLITTLGPQNFDATARAYFFDEAGAPRLAGHNLKSPDFAATLRAIQSGGRDGFYKGPVAAAIAGPRFDSITFLAVLEKPGILGRRSDQRREYLHDLFMQTLAFVDGVMTTIGHVNQMMRLDDLIKRLMVMLLVPDLLESDSATTLSQPSSVGFPHAELVDWALAHLDQPISLTDLEQRSCYGRRSLQYTFKQHFGCGPMQWLRQQRLEKAMRLLRESGGRYSLNEVAQACGYLSQSSFSRDFLKRYGQRPSMVRRQSQAI